MPIPGTLLSLSSVLGQGALRAPPQPSPFPLHSVRVLPPTPWRLQFPFLGHNAWNLDSSGWFLKLYKEKKKKTGITSELVVSHLRQAERANRTAVGSQSSHSDPHTSLYMDSYTRAIN